jgi:hypothetical protein
MVKESQYAAEESEGRNQKDQDSVAQSRLRVRAGRRGVLVAHGATLRCGMRYSQSEERNASRAAYSDATYLTHWRGEGLLHKRLMARKG